MSALLNFMQGILKLRNAKAVFTDLEYSKELRQVFKPTNAKDIAVAE